MDYEQRLAISYYKTIAALNESHKVYLAQHIDTQKIYVKKYLGIYNLQVYKYLKAHPIEGLPAVIDFYEDEENNQLILIEEYITGTSLQDLIVDKKLTVSLISNYTEELCRILDSLHSANPPIIHRDIKPSNVVITNTNHVVLLDFNAAKEYHAQSASDTVLIGTHGYAAPEQYGFMASSPQTDIYSLGILLKEMTDTLEMPASAEDISQIGILRNIILRCTQFKPEDRYKSVLEIIEVLNQLPFLSQNQQPGVRANQESDIGSDEEKKSQEQYPYNRKKETDHSSSNRKRSPNQNSLRRFLPPGFRSGNLRNEILAIFGYFFLFAVSFSMDREEPLFHNQTAEQLWVAFSLLAGVVVGSNYLNIQSRLPLCNFKHPLLRLLGATFMTLLTPMLLLVIGVILS